MGNACCGAASSTATSNLSDHLPAVPTPTHHDDHQVTTSTARQDGRHTSSEPNTSGGQYVSKQEFLIDMSMLHREEYGHHHPAPVGSSAWHATSSLRVLGGSGSSRNGSDNNENVWKAWISFSQLRYDKRRSSSGPTAYARRC